MSRTIGFLLACLTVVSCSLISGQVRETSIPVANEETYDTQDYGDCTFVYGKDRTTYIQPYVMCTSGIEVFSLIPQKDGKWVILLSPGEETEVSDEGNRFSTLAVKIKIDDYDVHEISMMWPKRLSVAFGSFELPELHRLLDELRRGDSMIISRNDEDIEFDLSRANQAFVELVFEQWIALNKLKSVESP